MHASGEPSTSANLFRDKDDFVPIVLDGEGYDGAPQQTAANYRGLLRNTLAATLYTQNFIQHEKSMEEHLERMVHGDLGTVAQLIGLAPIEYHTNVDSWLNMDGNRVKLQTTSAHMALESNQSSVRITWRHPQLASGSENRVVTQFKEDELAVLLASIYTSMFESEEPTFSENGLNAINLRRHVFPLNNRAGFVLFLRLVKDRVFVHAWDEAMHEFFKQAKVQVPGRHDFPYYHELILYMHILDVYTSPDLLFTGNYHAFAALHVGHGWVHQRGSKFTDDFKLTVVTDDSKPLDEISVGFHIRGNRVTESVFKELLGPMLTIFETNVADENAVFVTKSMPGVSGTMAISSATRPSEAQFSSQARHIVPYDGFIVSMHAQVDPLDASIPFVTCHVELASEELRSVPFNMDGVYRPSDATPFSYVIDAHDAIPGFVVDFPIPVSESGTSVTLGDGCLDVRIRTSPMAWAANPTALYPTILNKALEPVLINLAYVNLDLQPAIDSLQSSRLDWLKYTLHAQFTPRENFYTRSPQSFDGANTDRLQFCILVSKLRIDLGNKTPLLDAALVIMHKDNAKELGAWGDYARGPDISRLTVDDGEIDVWRQALAAWAERCRTWQHGPDCAYKKVNQQSVPLPVPRGRPSLADRVAADRVMCSCGVGKFPEGYLAATPYWKLARQQAVRVAIAPIYPCNLVQETGIRRDTRYISLDGSGSGTETVMSGEEDSNCTMGSEAGSPQ
ncbi:unnamed protein product [Parascedosporium putredinis]|uniref:Uncharacterized protein n=1 Tax=Parascedosporium putredinis TaxID=1442378 RepID=A0A9P1M8K5_9PEZI|nr:unnamed protein product [Parascedosporium putredinis]CAI7990114.1 unnamed protein product [Parascedosporium putredinis]